MHRSIEYENVQRWLTSAKRCMQEKDHEGEIAALDVLMKKTKRIRKQLDKED